MARRGVIGVARLVDFLVPVRERELHLALEDVPHMRALASIIGEPCEEGCHIGVRRVRLETDGVRPEVLEVTFVPFDLNGLGRARLRRFRHWFLLSSQVSFRRPMMMERTAAYSVCSSTPVAG